MRHALIVMCLLSAAAVLSASAGPPTASAQDPAAQRIAAAWPSDSLHHVDVPLQTSQGRTTTFAATAGRVRLVTMFYATCPVMCQLTIDTLRSIDRSLTPRERARLGVVLLTMDPERDSVESLHEVAEQRHLDEERWILARASEPDTRLLAGVLGIRYRQLDDMNFEHSSVMILLDPQGRVLARGNTGGTPDPEFVAAVRQALASS
jgi:protein SCO1/2